MRLPDIDRSPVARLGVQVASPFAVMVAVYMLFAGHNRPGGGFAAGLVLGAVLALRTVTGLQRPAGARWFLAAGLGLAAVVAAAPLVLGEPLLDQVVVEDEYPVIGKVKTGSALPFDVGVMFVVMGLVSAVLEAFRASSLAGQEETA